MISGTLGSWSYCTHGHQARTDECWHSAHFFFLLFFFFSLRTPIHETPPSPSGWDFPPQLNFFGNTSNISPELHLPGGCKCSQVRMNASHHVSLRYHPEHCYTGISPHMNAGAHVQSIAWALSAWTRYSFMNLLRIRNRHCDHLLLLSFLTS